MPIPLQCAAEGCTFREELPDDATVKGKPAVQWWREDCNYRCRQHRDGSTEHNRAVELAQRELGATVIGMDMHEAHARQESYDVSAARAARDVAMQQVDAAADETWKEQAKDAVVRLASLQPTLTSDDIWKQGVPKPEEPRALGPIMSWAQSQKIIAATDQTVQTEQVSAHARPVRVWKSLLYHEPGRKIV